MTSLFNRIRYAEAAEVKPTSALDKQVARIIPRLLSQTLSDLAPDADALEALSS